MSKSAALELQLKPSNYRTMRLVKPIQHCVLLLCFLVLSMAGCDTQRRSVESISGSTMGTTFTIKFIPGAGSPDISTIGNAVDTELTSVNLQLSTYQDDAEVFKFNQSDSTDWFTVSKQTASVVQLALDFHKLSDGAFDITVGSLINQWGFGADAKPDNVPSNAAIEKALSAVGSEKLSVRLDPPAIKKHVAQLKIDLSAIGKGHAVDRVAAKLESLGVQNYLIEIGGEIRSKGNRVDGQDWQVAVERPNVEKLTMSETVGLPDAAMATSTRNRNAVEIGGVKFHHFIDPKTGRPVDTDLISACVIMQDCASADAAATALMTLGFSKAMQLTERQKWAALLVVRREDKIEAVSSAEFERLTNRFIKQ